LIKALKIFPNEKAFILIVFLCIESIKLVSCLISDASEIIKIVELIGLIFYFVLCFMAYRSYKVATWIISVIMFLIGIGTFVGGVSYFFLDHDQFWIQIFAILHGAYFTYGGIKLIYIELKGGKKNKSTQVR